MNTNKKTLPFALLGLGLLVAGSAQASLQDELQRCAEIRNAAERLFCFDSLAANTSGADASRPAPAATPSARPAAATASARPQPAAPAGQQDSEATDDFGLEREKIRQGPDTVVSRFDGRFDGWTGETLFPLENGQVWKQADAGRLAYQADRPLITIRRGWFGAYYLKVEGANKQVRVKRIK